MPSIGKRGHFQLSKTKMSKFNTEVARFQLSDCSKALQITPQTLWLGTRVGGTEVADCVSRHCDATLRMGSYASNLAAHCRVRVTITITYPILHHSFHLRSLSCLAPSPFVPFNTLWWWISPPFQLLSLTHRTASSIQFCETDMITLGSITGMLPCSVNPSESSSLFPDTGISHCPLKASKSSHLFKFTSAETPHCPWHPSDSSRVTLGSLLEDVSFGWSGRIRSISPIVPRHSKRFNCCPPSCGFTKISRFNVLIDHGKVSMNATDVRGVNSAKVTDSSVGLVPVVHCFGVVHMEEEVQDRVQVEVGREEQGVGETHGKEQDEEKRENKRSTAQHGWPWVWSDAHKDILEPWCECTSFSVRTVHTTRRLQWIAISCKRNQL